ncbi:MAG: lipoyl(octanoyl) transferase LipB [Ignavibacteria bacterium]|nr:lipoyl(octanoyl) transferase LipB [Ignavibacteria bacterium]
MIVEDWGVLDFNDAWRRQRELTDAILHQDHPDTLVFCQHRPVITLGRNTQAGSILASSELLSAMGVEVIEIDRGGEATMHNPGQLVGYPIFNLQRSKPDLHWFLRTIEQCVIDALAEFDIESGRVDSLTGVWIGQVHKICAIGIHCSRWVTSHGFALNVNNDLGLFSAIVPCGITEMGVTSMSEVLGAELPFATVQEHVAQQFFAKFS